jgi:type I restriction enzyme S subunit
VSWPMVKLAGFCKTSSGGTPSRKVVEYYDGDIPWVKSGDLRESIVTEVSEHITQLAIEKSSAKIVPAGAILLAMYGATVGRMAWLGIDAATNQAVCSIIPDKSKAFPKYVYYALLSKVPHFLNEAVGGAQPNISQGLIRETEIPLPPLAEQKRIAAILDKADAIRRKRQQAIQLADDFLRAVFLDMFGDPVTNPKGLKITTIGHLCDVATGATPSRKVDSYYGGGIPWVKTTEVDGYIINTTEESISEEGLKNSNCKVNPSGSIVLAMYGQGKTRGKVGILGVPAATNQACAVIKPTSNILMGYLYVYLQLSYESLRALGQGAGQPNLNLSIVKSFPVILPDHDSQERFVRLTQFITESKEKISNGTVESSSLFRSLSQKAFRGEL